MPQSNHIFPKSGRQIFLHEGLDIDEESANAAKARVRVTQSQVQVSTALGSGATSAQSLLHSEDDGQALLMNLDSPAQQRQAQSGIEAAGIFLGVLKGSFYGQRPPMNRSISVGLGLAGTSSPLTWRRVGPYSGMSGRPPGASTED